MFRKAAELAVEKRTEVAVEKRTEAIVERTAEVAVEKRTEVVVAQRDPGAAACGKATLSWGAALGRMLPFLGSPASACGGRRRLELPKR
jgi:hypothetical protein